jgi:hypothetical protein
MSYILHITYQFNQTKMNHSPANFASPTRAEKRYLKKKSKELEKKSKENKQNDTSSKKKCCTIS